MDRTVEDLLLEWEERRDRGCPVTPAELCAETPNLIPELERRVRLLTLCDKYLHDETTQDRRCEPTREIPVGRVIGQYEVRRLLGRGGTGDVYEAWDPILRRAVAIKVFRTGETVTARLEREAQALAQLHHPNIVPVYEAKSGHGPPYFVMEYVAGGTLADRRDELRAEGPRSVARLMARIAHAVQAAHEVGILHRDLKPSNILLTPEGEPRVADFGLAKWIAERPPDREGRESRGPDPGDDAPASGLSLTVPGFQPGTPAYMAPEQFDPRFGRISPQTDIWALGVILRELLIGTRPFVAKSRDELRQLVCEDVRSLPRDGVTTQAAAVIAIADRCLMRDPADRFASAGAVAAALDHYDRSLARRTVRRTALVAVLGILLLVGLVWATRPPDPFDAQAAGTSQQLARGERVELIRPDGPEPAYRLRSGHGASGLGMTPEGFRIHTKSICVVELLPDLPATKWRVEVELQHTHNGFKPAENALVGVLIASAHFTKGEMEHHLIGGAWLHEYVRPNGLPTAECNWKRFSSSLSENLVTPAGEFTQKANSSVTFATTLPGEQVPFRVVSLERTERGIDVTWVGGEGTMGQLAADSAPFRSKLQIDFPVIASTHWQSHPRLGLVVSGGDCVVRRLTLDAVR